MPLFAAIVIISIMNLIGMDEAICVDKKRLVTGAQG